MYSKLKEKRKIVWSLEISALEESIKKSRNKT